jgi:hypothetical protein
VGKNDQHDDFDDIANVTQCAGDRGISQPGRYEIGLDMRAFVRPVGRTDEIQPEGKNQQKFLGAIEIYSEEVAGQKRGYDDAHDGEVADDENGPLGPDDFA